MWSAAWPYADRVTHFLLVLFAGNYQEAARRRDEGMPDQYRHHSYAIDTLERAVERGVRVSVIQLHSGEPYDAQGVSGIRFIGLGSIGASHGADAIAKYMQSEEVTHAMARFPSAEVLLALAASSARTSAVLADSFPYPERYQERYSALSTALSDPGVDFVANHHVASSEQLIDVLGLDPSRVIPWDWPLDLKMMAESSARPHPGAGEARLCYVGSLERTKGVWDVLVALRLLRIAGVPASLDLAGSGNERRLNQLVHWLGLRQHVRFHGRLGGEEVVGLMRASEFVVVPSWHSYPEGRPLTIYEAMASGTPIVASDHPMFASAVRHDATGFVYRARRPDLLALTVRRAWRDATRYGHVSATAAAHYPALGHPTLWGDLLLRWLGDSDEDRAWLRERTVAELGRGTTAR